MIAQRKLCRPIATVAAALTFATFAVSVEPGADDPQPTATATTAAATTTTTAARPSIAVARDRAILMHKIYAATLHAMHEHYFHANRSVLPARAMEDVFDEVSEESDMESRWVAVNTPAMGVRHEPRDDFEKRGAVEIAAGKEAYETVENGQYRRIGAIPLAGGCVNCHLGFTMSESSTPRFAGLAIRIPIDNPSDKK